MYPFSETPTRNPVSTTADLSKPIDPQNPFDNLMENPAYRTDYRRAGISCQLSAVTDPVCDMHVCHFSSDGRFLFSVFWR